MLRHVITNLTIGVCTVLLLMFLGINAMYAEHPELPKLREMDVLWKSQQPDNYSFVVEEFCFCDNQFPYTVVESRGNIFVYPLPDMEEVYYQVFSMPEDPISIDDVFNMAFEGMRNKDNVTVEYDTRYGFPILIEIDPQSGTFDDDYSVVISDFKIL
ncbi:MAG: DUF6174 domain-containing protein [Gammaproteobacteria bacterium]|nr:hypothetical protein [Pseudomonadales bacterium]